MNSRARGVVKELAILPTASARARRALQLERRLFHLGAASALPLLSLVAPRWTVLALAAGAVALAVTGEAARLLLPSFNRWLLARLGVLFKASEHRRVTGATYLAVATLVAFLAFPPPVAAVALLFVAVGDPTASIVGTNFGRARLGKKSLEGTIAFLAVALGLAVLCWWGGLYGPLWAGLLAAVVATCIEALPLPVDDNFSVPLLGGLVLVATWAPS